MSNHITIEELEILELDRLVKQLKRDEIQTNEIAFCDLCLQFLDKLELRGLLK